MTDLNTWGRMAAYITAGASFEQFVTEQEPGFGDDNQRKWDSLVEWRRNNPGVALDIPYD